MYLYIAINNLMPAYCKIGISQNVAGRMECLYGDWTAINTWDLGDKALYYEGQIKYRMRDFIAHGYELFNCPVSYLSKIVDEILNTPEIITIPPTAVIFDLDMTNIGKVVRSTRKKQELTIHELAGLCNVSHVFIHALENGKQSCQIDKVFCVLKMLGITPYGYTKSY